MSRKVSKPTQRLNMRPVILVGLLVALVLAAGLTLRVTQRVSQDVVQSDVPHFVDLQQQEPENHHAVTSTRTTVIAQLGEQVPHMSGESGPLMTTLVSGKLPDTATTATVRTDENCTPDADGVSHCLNELDFGATQVVVQHHHKMSMTPCLTPGEVVNIMSIAQYTEQSQSQS